MEILNLIPASRVIDVLAVDTDRYAGNFEHDLEEYLEGKGYEFVSIFDDHMCRRSRKSVFVESLQGLSLHL